MFQQQSTCWLRAGLGHCGSESFCTTPISVLSRAPRLRCYRPAPFGAEDALPMEAEMMAVTHCAHTLHRALWLLMLPEEAAISGGDGGSLLDTRLPKELEAGGRPLLDGMAGEAVAALQVGRGADRSCSVASPVALTVCACFSAPCLSGRAVRPHAARSLT